MVQDLRASTPFRIRHFNHFKNWTEVLTESKNYCGQKSQSDLHSAEGHKDRTDFKTIMTVTEENKSAALYSLVCMDGYLHTTLSQSYPPSYSTF